MSGWLRFFFPTILTVSCEVNEWVDCNGMKWRRASDVIEYVTKLKSKRRSCLRLDCVDPPWQKYSASHHVAFAKPRPQLIPFNEIEIIHSKTQSITDYVGGWKKMDSLSSFRTSLLSSHPRYEMRYLSQSLSHYGHSHESFYESRSASSRPV